MAKEISVTVKGPEGKMVLRGANPGGHEILMDAPEPLGSGGGFAGLEALLASLAGCSGHTVLYLLGEMGQPASAIEVRATGLRRDEIPIVFTRITLEYKVAGPPAAAVEKAIALAEEKFCPVWAMLKGNVEIDWKVVG